MEFLKRGPETEWTEETAVISICEAFDREPEFAGVLKIIKWMERERERGKKKEKKKGRKYGQSVNDSIFVCNRDLAAKLTPRSS